MMDALISNLLAHKGEYRTAVAICRDAKVPVAKHSAAAMVRAVSSLLAARGFYLREKRGSYVSFSAIPDPESRKIIPPPERFDWTDEAVAELKRLHSTGLSMARIAAALGCNSRNAVIGKAHRLGLSSKQPKKAEPKKTPLKTPHGGGKRDLRPDTRRVSPLKIGRQVALKPRPSRHAPVSEPAPQPIAAPTVAGLKLIDLGLFHCRWVIGDAAGPDTIYCGMPSTRGSYCACHAAIAYRPRVERPRKAGRAA